MYTVVWEIRALSLQWADRVRLGGKGYEGDLLKKGRMEMRRAGPNLVRYEAALLK